MNNTTAIRQLGQSLGLPLEISAGEACELVIGDDLSVLISGDPDATRLQLSGTVSSFPVGDRASVATALLKANYNGQGTGAAALSLDPLTEDVVLTRAFDVAGGNLTAAVEEFANYLEFWRSRIDSLVGGDSQAVSDSAPPLAAIRI
ncbi:MAG TPA: type III secretion system chaperone [Caulifigura sp.]|jgi:hypothetical protein|nr:type III secretion system chaperone [Caulifigura sp.]